MSNTNQPLDDSLAYARSLEKAETHDELEVNDPLAAVKDMRLQQLAACRIKTEKTLKNSMTKSKTHPTETSK